MVGQTVSNYQIVAKLGKGGMGVVYKALDRRLNRFLALKFIIPEASSTDRKRRFFQEAKAASALNHPNIIHIYDIGEWQGADYIAMEFVEGVTLQQALRKNGLPPDEALRYAIQVADALAGAHAGGIVHRDLKPGNVMLGPRGLVKILDFGLAKLKEPEIAMEGAAGSDSSDTRTLFEPAETKAGAILGSPAYMSPEQVLGKPVDARSDIFAFGVLLYEMLTGKQPFTGKARPEIFSATLHADPPQPSAVNPAVHRELDWVIAHCLRKDPERRFQSMLEVKIALEDLRAGATSGAVPAAIPASRRSKVGAAADTKQESCPPAEVRRQLEKILADPTFRSSQRLSAFLRYAVESTLAGRAESLKEYVLGAEVFRRGEAFDPQTDNVVRVNANRLRSRLAEYYHKNGKSDPIVIDVPRGRYVPVFSRSQPARHALESERAPVPARIVGRDKELLQLRAAFDSVSGGTGRMVTVSGDAGIGKTTVIEDFLSTIEAEGAQAWIARGRCSERLEKTDPFAPILECLEDLIRGKRAGEALQAMENAAPLWLAQLEPQRAGGAGSLTTASSERLRREFTRFFQALSAIQPVLLFLDDLHWVDASTCDLLAHLGSRARDTRILLMAAYRPSKVAGAHPFPPVKLALERQDASEEIALGFLTRSDIERYLRGRFPENRFAAEFADAIYERTEGHPLFMKDMVSFLADRRMIVNSDGQWQLNLNIADMRSLIPAGTESVIRLQIDQFSDTDRRILQCAAVQGVEFDSAVICRVLSMGAEQTEERLQALARVHRFVQSLGERSFPDETFSIRYRFVHALYQNALYADLAPTRRATYSLSVAESLIGFAADTAPAMAAELGLLFERGRDKERASQQFLRAARHAAGVFAFPEAILLCERGLKNLDSAPASHEREARELDFSLTQGMARMVTFGYASPEVERTYRRARELCLRLQEKRRLMPVLWAIHTCVLNAGELVSALESAHEMLQLAEELDNPAALIESLHALGTTLAFMGNLPEARTALEKALYLAGEGGHKSQPSLYVLDTYVTSLSMLARVLARMGLLDEAIDKAVMSVNFANRLNHPPSLAYATFWVGWIRHARGEYAEACVPLESAMDLSRAYGFPSVLEWGRVLRGSSLAHLGKVEEGISEMRKSLENQMSMRCLVERPFCLMLLAEALLTANCRSEALRLCDEAEQIAERTEARSYEAEIRRLRERIAPAPLSAKPRRQATRDSS